MPMGLRGEEMLASLIIFVVAMIFAVWSWHKDDIGAIVLSGIVAYVNCPFAIEYLINVLK